MTSLIGYCNLFFVPAASVIYQKNVFESIIDQTFDLQRERESLIYRVVERLGMIQQLTHRCYKENVLGSRTVGLHLAAHW